MSMLVDDFWLIGVPSANIVGMSYNQWDVLKPI